MRVYMKFIYWIQIMESHYYRQWTRVMNQWTPALKRNNSAIIYWGFFVALLLRLQPCSKPLSSNVPIIRWINANGVASLSGNQIIISILSYYIMILEPTYKSNHAFMSCVEVRMALSIPVCLSSFEHVSLSRAPCCLSEERALALPTFGPVGLLNPMIAKRCRDARGGPPPLREAGGWRCTSVHDGASRQHRQLEPREGWIGARRSGTLAGSMRVLMEAN